MSSFLTAHQHNLGYLVPVMVSWMENYTWGTDGQKIARFHKKKNKKEESI